MAVNKSSKTTFRNFTGWIEARFIWILGAVTLVTLVVFRDHHSSTLESTTTQARARELARMHHHRSFAPDTPSPHTQLERPSHIQRMPTLSSDLQGFSSLSPTAFALEGIENPIENQTDSTSNSTLSSFWDLFEDQKRMDKMVLEASSNNSVIRRRRPRSSRRRPVVEPLRWKIAAKVVGSRKAAFVSQAGTKDALSYNHMAMVEVLPGGHMMTVWQGSVEGEGNKDQHLQYAFSVDPTGREWTAAKSIKWTQGPDAFNGETPRWSPVLQWVGEDGSTTVSHNADARGVVQLIYTQSTKQCRAPGGDIKMMTMSWPSKNWSMPYTIYSFEEEAKVPGINKVLANRLAVLSNGLFVLPYWREKGRSCPNVDDELAGKAGVLVSPDQGRTWKGFGEVSAMPKTWLIEQTVVEVDDGELVMLCRTQADFIYRVDSHDYGRTWGSPKPLKSMPNPNAKIAAIGLTTPITPPPGMESAPKCILLAHNDHKLLPQALTRVRTMLTLSASCNEEHTTWERILTIESSKVPGLRHHYPTLVQLPEFASPKHLRVILVYSTFFMKKFKKTESEGIKAIAVDLSFDAVANPSPPPQDI
ncbi:hypothetical protein CYMTET_22021 [Cymbomonas tetramitiformis]|uniref:Sialidase domain-containing protein n=1 Tax=Cymbomonas tetramitiformis TaxID=36881 RepID=A0AAE0G257_9CHLO|nr:hypothetical protein CYMTET_22021 [Cymbomonas tetramitiformis]